MEHWQRVIFVTKKKKVVRRLLSSNLTILSLLLTPQWLEQLFPNHYQPSDTGHPITQLSALKIFLAEKSLIETIVGYNLHQGILAIAKVPTELSLNETVERLRQPYFFVALDGLVNSENVGVIVRNSAAFGVDGIIVGETSSSPYLRRAVRNSMGAVFQIPVIHSNSLKETLTTLKHQYQVKIIATHPHDESSIYSSNLSGNICIVLGNEGEGISNKILNVCDECITIPMMKNTDSLNVASASAVFLYEVRKQRGK
ncbi:MAG: RNA methyltransferase [Ignavibacteriales bacterium]|nr:RNA methyltransferase [Ignavibacteriales bacterium]